MCITSALMDVLQIVYNSALSVKELNLTGNARCTYCSYSIIFTSLILTGTNAHSLGSSKNSPMLSCGVHFPKGK